MLAPDDSAPDWLASSALPVGRPCIARCSEITTASVSTSGCNALGVPVLNKLHAVRVSHLATMAMSSHRRSSLAGTDLPEH